MASVLTLTIPNPSVHSIELYYCRLLQTTAIYHNTITKALCSYKHIVWAAVHNYKDIL